MARKRRRTTSAKTISKRSLGDIAAVWKALILFNLLISVFGFWMIYSQNNYILETVEAHMPVAIAAPYKATTVVVNPLTGQFILVDTFTLTALFLALMVLAGMYFLLQERL